MRDGVSRNGERHREEGEEGEGGGRRGKNEEERDGEVNFTRAGNFRAQQS